MCNSPHPRVVIRPWLGAALALAALVGCAGPHTEVDPGANATAANLEPGRVGDARCTPAQSWPLLSTDPQDIPGFQPAPLSPGPDNVDIDCPAPPNTFDVSSFFAAAAPLPITQAAGPTWDGWAWASFAAMNWPALEAPSDQAAAFPTGFVRGVPDPSASFAGAGHDSVLVWETFKEKRELFRPGISETEQAPPAISASSAWQDVTFAQDQLPNSGEGAGIEPCVPEQALSAQQLDGHFRTMGQASKVLDVSSTFNTGDETVEVASQAREAASTLCAGLPTGTSDTVTLADGTVVPTQAYCTASIFPDGDLDARTPVGPRVWKGDPADEGARPLYFEVKVNYDFWRYVLDKGYYLDATATAAATSADRGEHPKLPFRSSSGQGPQRSPDAVFDYDAGGVAARYAGPLSDPNTLPGVGSIQLKAGWLVLNDDEIASKDFHTTQGITFHLKPDAPDVFPEDQTDEYTCYEQSTFGLVALHIIQRVHSLAPVNREESFSLGGTFVFATWEHNSIEQGSDYHYANYLAFPGNFTQVPADPPVDAPIPPFAFNVEEVPFPYWPADDTSAIQVTRDKPYPLESTQAVNQAAHSAIAAVNPESVWLNYSLVGTQFYAAEGPESEEMYNQPYYLANLVVETNTDLQDFQGLPPGVQVTPYYTEKVGLTNTQHRFDRDAANVVFNRQNLGARHMGGCMGCHGVAQLGGYNFSFVFKGGQDGGGLDTQKHFNVAGGGTIAEPPSTTGGAQ